MTVQTIHLKPYSSLQNRDYTTETKIIFDKSDFNSTNYKSGTFVFFIRNCKFKTLRIENTENIDFKDISFNFFQCYIERLEIENIITLNSSFLFSACIISGRVASENIQYITLSNCLLSSSFLVLNAKKVHISYTEENVFLLSWLKLFRALNTTFEKFASNPMQYHISNCEYITYYMSEYDDLTEGVYRDLYSQNIEDKIRYRLKKEEKEYLKITLSIDYTVENEHQLTKVSKAKLSSLSLKGTCTGKITIENSRIDNLYIRDFSVLKDCNLYNIKPFRENATNKKIEIHQCNLDDVWFDNVSFDSYADISLYRNNYNRAKITSCQFPIKLEGFDKFKTVENIHYPDKKDDNYYRIRYETFLQLKNILEESDGFYEAQKLRTVSLQALQQVEALSFWDKMILKINNLSNRHGISIARPLGWFMLISIVLYILYLVTLGKIFIPTSIDWKLFGYYFSFLDVTHNLDFLVDKKELTGLSIIIDYINKVVVGFLLFQFVAAFRKYIRK